MKRLPATTRRTRILVLTGVAAACYYSVLIACGEGFSITQVPETHNCTITSHTTYFPQNGYLHLDDPEDCPFAILGGPTQVNYAAHGSFVPSDVTGTYRLVVIDMAGNTAAADVTPMWTYADSTYLEATGWYFAGDGGFNGTAFGSPGYDDAHNILGTPFHGDQEAVARLDYEKDPPKISIEGPTGVASNGRYHLDGYIHDVNFVNPVTWSWYVDGVLQDQTTSYFNGIADPTGGYTQEVQAYAVDGNGKQLTEGHEVTTCPNGQRSC